MKNVLNKIAGVTVVLLTCVFSMGTTWQIGQPASSTVYVDGATISCGGMVDGVELPYVVSARDAQTWDVITQSNGTSQTMWWSKDLTPPGGTWGTTPVDITLTTFGEDDTVTPTYVRVHISGL